MSLPETDLHAWLDGELDAGRHAEVAALIAASPQAQARAAHFGQQKSALHAAYDDVVDEPIPEHLLATLHSPPKTRIWRHAAVAAWLTIGGIVGWMLHGAAANAPALQTASLPRDAAIAHAVFVPEVRHPVEVGADQEAHLVAWLSKRLGTPLKAPQLTEHGFDLVGGRLLPGESGPVAHFMYQDSSGRRLTLYVRSDAQANRETAFRFATENRLAVFYWVDGKLGYALSAELPRESLLPIATTAYRQLNP